MSQKFEKLIEKAGTGYSLSEAEKARMDRVVTQYMRFKPLPQAQTYSISASYSWFSFAHKPLAAALCLVLIFGTGISYAAESALPGDALYAVKTYINEPARVALATNAEAKAEIQIELAERRIDEAATLAAEGRLDTDTQNELASAFESHATAASENIEKTDETDSPAAAELASRFETRLAAHDEILAEVQSDESGETHDLADAIHGAGRAVAIIRARAEEKAGVSAPLEIAFLTGQAKVATFAATSMRVEDTRTMEAATGQSTTTSDVSRSAAVHMQSAAHKQFDTMRKKADKKRDKISVEAKADIDSQLARAEELIANGEAQLDEGEIALAFHSFQDSLVITEKLGVMLKAAPTLAKVNSRRGSDRNEIRNALNARRGTNASTSTTMQATATTEIKAPVEVKIQAGSSGSGGVGIENVLPVLPPSVQIFPSHEKDENDGGEDHDKKDSKIKIDLDL